VKGVKSASHQKITNIVFENTAVIGYHGVKIADVDMSPNNRIYRAISTACMIVPPCNATDRASPLCCPGSIFKRLQLLKRSSFALESMTKRNFQAIKIRTTTFYQTCSFFEQLSHGTTVQTLKEISTVIY
jgi:hypothetical protein